MGNPETKTYNPDGNSKEELLDIRNILESTGNQLESLQEELSSAHAYFVLLQERLRERRLRTEVRPQSIAISGRRLINAEVLVDDRLFWVSVVADGPGTTIKVNFPIGKPFIELSASGPEKSVALVGRVAMLIQQLGTALTYLENGENPRLVLEGEVLAVYERIRKEQEERGVEGEEQRATSGGLGIDPVTGKTVTSPPLSVLTPADENSDKGAESKVGSLDDTAFSNLLRGIVLDVAGPEAGNGFQLVDDVYGTDYHSTFAFRRDGKSYLLDFRSGATPVSPVNDPRRAYHNLVCGLYEVRPDGSRRPLGTVAREFSSPSENRKEFSTWVLQKIKEQRK